MLLTIQEVINKVNNIDSTIKWMDDEWGQCTDEHKEYMFDTGAKLLKEYRSIILNAQVDL